MINILRSLIDVATNLVEFVVSFFTSFANLLLNIPMYIAFIINNITSLPSILIPFATASISLYVVFLLLGRNN